MASRDTAATCARSLAHRARTRTLPRGAPRGERERAVCTRCPTRRLLVIHACKSVACRRRAFDDDHASEGRRARAIAISMRDRLMNAAQAVRQERRGSRRTRSGIIVVTAPKTGTIYRRRHAPERARSASRAGHRASDRLIPGGLPRGSPAEPAAMHAGPRQRVIGPGDVHRSTTYRLNAAGPAARASAPQRLHGDVSH